MRSEIREYVNKVRRRAKLDKNGNAVLIVDTQKIGMVVAVARGAKKFTIGWSLCDVRAGDIFNPSEAYDKALGRAMAKQEDEIPHTIARYLRETDFLARAKYELNNRTLLKRPAKVAKSESTDSAKGKTKVFSTLKPKAQVKRKYARVLAS